MAGSENGEREEHRQIGGIPAGGRGWRPIVEEAEPRFLGMPTRWMRPRPEVDLRWVRHPVRWLRWRLEVRRLGPYARSFDEWSAASAPPRDAGDGRAHLGPDHPRPPGP